MERKYWIEWRNRFEGWTYSESVTEEELLDRLNDPVIEMLRVDEPLIQ